MKYLGLVLVLLSWLAGAYILRKWRGTNAMSISQHAVTNRQASWLFTTTLCVLGPLFYYWLVKWFAPELSLGGAFTTLATLTFACQFVAGLIPDHKGWQRRAHRGAAYGMAYLFLPLSWLILNAPAIGPFAHWFGAICFAWMITSLGLTTFIASTRRQYLVYQTAYIMTFQIQILASAYIS